VHQIYQEMQDMENNLDLQPDKIKDPRSRYWKERIADPWRQIHAVLGWKIIILTDQLPISWIIFEEERYEHGQFCVVDS
jgi:hypothetical protein